MNTRNVIASGITFGYLVALAAAVVITDYRRERDRIKRVVIETRERLATVAPDRLARARAEERAAVYDRAAWGDPAPAPTVREGD